MLSAHVRHVQHPHPDDPAVCWRRWAAHTLEADLAWTEVRAQLAALDAVRLDHVLPVLLRRARPRVRAELLARVADHCAQHTPGPGTVYALLGELMTDPGAGRDACIRALCHAQPASRDAVSLAVSLVTRTNVVRPSGVRERQAGDAWRARATESAESAGSRRSCPWDAVLAEKGDRADLRAWVHGDGAPAVFDHALVLATAGAGSATVDQVRVMLKRVVDATGRASHGAFALLEHLASVSGSSEGLPASTTSPAWPELFAQVRVLCAVHELGPARTLEHLARVLDGTPDALRTLRAALELCVTRAWLGPDRERSARALRETVPLLLDALLALVPAAQQGGLDVQIAPAQTATAPVCGELFSLLLGRVEREPGTHVTRPAWLTDDLRAMVLRAALQAPALHGMGAALRDLELRGVPVPLLAPLREVARHAEDVFTRQHARQLARGERL